MKDIGLALDFNRTCNLRLMMFDAEIQREQAEAMKDGAADVDQELTLSEETVEMAPRGTF